ncbi:MAG: RNA-binding domain-containing protein [Anaerolineales bacterium]
MMVSDSFTLHKSPFFFIRLLVIVEFFFAFLPIFIAFVFPVQAEYNRSALARSVSFAVMAIIVLTSLQILSLALSFFAWYLPVYQVDADKVAYKRAGGREFRELIEISSISCLSPRQGWLGRRFDFGDLQIFSNSEAGEVWIRNIADPIGVAIRLEELVSNHWNPPNPVDILPVTELIAAGESDTVEFKSSILWDYRQKKTNKSLSEPIIKSVTAFMNSTGGALLIGIHDSGQILGLERDFAAMKKSNPDGFELIFNNAFNQMVGAEFRSLVRLSFPVVEGKTICLVAVQPALHPVYFRHQGQEDFYIRAGNASQPLAVSQATSYIRDRFQS